FQKSQTNSGAAGQPRKNSLFSRFDFGDGKGQHLTGLLLAYDGGLAYQGQHTTLASRGLGAAVTLCRTIGGVGVFCLGLGNLGVQSLLVQGVNQYVVGGFALKELLVGAFHDAHGVLILPQVGAVVHMVGHGAVDGVALFVGEVLGDGVG